MTRDELVNERIVEGSWSPYLTSYPTGCFRPLSSKRGRSVSAEGSLDGGSSTCFKQSSR